MAETWRSLGTLHAGPLVLGGLRNRGGELTVLVGSGLGAGVLTRSEISASAVSCLRYETYVTLRQAANHGNVTLNLLSNRFLSDEVHGLPVTI